MKHEDRVKIDEIDAQILKELLKDARKTFTEIAKECERTPAGVRAKFLRMKNLGVINGAIMPVNPHNLGFECVCDITMKTNSQKEVEKFLENKSYKGKVLRQIGQQNISFSVILPSINELQKILQDVAKCEHVKNLEPLIWVEATNIDHQENLVIRPLGNKSKPETRCSQITQKRKSLKLDEKTLEIAKILTKKARTPFSEIGQTLQLPTQTVIRKYDLLKENILNTPTITVDLQKLGYKAMVKIALKSYNKSAESRIYSELLQISNLIVAIRHIGIYDLGIIIVLEDFDDWFEVEKKIKKIEGIARMDISFDKAFQKWPLNLFEEILTKDTTKQGQTTFRQIG